jgi:hypothetical protein
VTAPAAPEKDDTLRFAVVDDDDLAVMSAHLQDATLAVNDVAYLARPRRFAAVVCRVDWDALAKGQPKRRQTGFHFERVLRVQRSGFDPTATAPLHLLAIAFRPTSAPAGEVILTFAGGPMIKLEVECLEAEMRDISSGWAVDSCPRHDLDALEPAR